MSTNLPTNNDALIGHFVESMAVTRASLELLVLEVAKLRAAVSGESLEAVLDEINDDLEARVGTYYRRAQERIVRLPTHLKDDIDRNLRGDDSDPPGDAA